MWVRNREEKKPKYSFTLSLMSSSNCHQIPGFPFTTSFLKDSSTHPVFPISLPLTLQTTPSWFLSPILPCNCPCRGHQPMWTLSRIFPLPDSQQQAKSNLLLSKHLPIPSFPHLSDHSFMDTSFSEISHPWNSVLDLVPFSGDSINTHEFNYHLPAANFQIFTPALGPCPLKPTGHPLLGVTLQTQCASTSLLFLLLQTYPNSTNGTIFNPMA